MPPDREACGLALRRAAFSEQVFLFAGQHEFALLVVHGHRDRDDPGCTLRGQRRDRQTRIERIAGIDRFQEFRRLLDKRDQRIADDMGEGAGAGRGKAQHLKPVRQRAGMAALAAIFDIVMDRVVVGRDGLKRREIGLGDGAARDVEMFADREVLEKPALRKAVPPPVERRRSCPALDSRAISIMTSLRRRNGKVQGGL